MQSKYLGLALLLFLPSIHAMELKTLDLSDMIEKLEALPRDFSSCSSLCERYLLVEAQEYKWKEFIQKADTNASVRDKTLLHIAARLGSHTCCKELIKRGMKVNGIDIFECTPLHGARNAATAQVLIDNGTDVNAATLLGDTPLHNAVQMGAKDVVELLITHGADVNAKRGRELYEDFNNLLHEHSHIPGLNYEPIPQYKDPLYNAFIYNKPEIAKILLENGAVLTEQSMIAKSPDLKIEMDSETLCSIFTSILYLPPVNHALKSDKVFWTALLCLKRCALNLDKHIYFKILKYSHHDHLVNFFVDKIRQGKKLKDFVNTFMIGELASLTIQKLKTLQQKIFETTKDANLYSLYVALLEIETSDDLLENIRTRLLSGKKVLSNFEEKEVSKKSTSLKPQQPKGSYLNPIIAVLCIAVLIKIAKEVFFDSKKQTKPSGKQNLVEIPEDQDTQPRVSPTEIPVDQSTKLSKIRALLT